MNTDTKLNGNAVFTVLIISHLQITFYEVADILMWNEYQQIDNTMLWLDYVIEIKRQINKYYKSEGNVILKNRSDGASKMYKISFFR